MVEGANREDQPMGIYDREYYRSEGPSFLGTIAHTGRMCLYLVLINVGLYLLQLVTFGGQEIVAVPAAEADEARFERRFDYGPVTEWLAMKPLETFKQLQVWRLVTGMFLHDPNNWFHIVWNMLFLWWFGKDMEDLYGSKEFLAFYLIAGICGNLLWGLTAFWMEGVDPARTMALGASGAVMAVLVLCTLHYPHRTIYLMFVLPVPLWLFTLLKIGPDLFYFLRGINLGVAVAGHLGAAAFGLLYWHRQLRILGLWHDLVSKARRTNKPRLRVYREEPMERFDAPPAEERLDRDLARRTDAVLEKISRLGKESLTPEERDLLQKASEQFRKRRR